MKFKDDIEKQNLKSERVEEAGLKEKEGVTVVINMPTASEKGNGKHVKNQRPVDRSI
ncbi:hypothetical protein [Bacillus sp. V3-13]|uniref:hypothetical protein n=1 Tax=Bacillus sp. V3-13 TaxID=2053728 RepID=UPI0015E11C6C|nr:hypothetical protein [Bacillus sp. V3-13]